jgi:hypothetical protein
MSLMGYRCRHCKSTKIQGTLPAWFRVNEEALTVVSVDVEADWEYAICEDCDESGDFYDLAEKAPDCTCGFATAPTYTAHDHHDSCAVKRTAP